MTPAIDQSVFIHRKRAFPCEWEGEIRTETITRWAYLTGVPRQTISTRFYSNRTARQCLGLDKIDKPVGKGRQNGDGIKTKERRQVSVASKFLAMPW